MLKFLVLWVTNNTNTTYLYSLKKVLQHYFKSVLKACPIPYPMVGENIFCDYYEQRESLLPMLHAVTLFLGQHSAPNSS